MKKINLRLTKKDKIVTAEGDTHNYISNSHWLIKYNKKYSKDIFTAGTNNKLKEYAEKIQVMEPDRLQGFIDNVMNNDSKYQLYDTGYFKEYGSNNFLKILATENGYMYINNNYMKLLNDITDYTRHHMNNTLRPIAFKHKKNDVTILITPIRHKQGSHAEKAYFRLENGILW